MQDEGFEGKKMPPIRGKIDPEIMKNVTAAKAFHGHLGPFVVLGVRIGLVGLRELGVEKGDARLHATAKLTYETPISCILDGIQLTTGCTWGNTRLTLEKSKEISVKLAVQRKNSLTVKVNLPALKLPKELMDKKLESKEVEDLAYSVASMPEEALFTVFKTSN